VLINPPPMPRPNPSLVDLLKKSLLLFSESSTCISFSALLMEAAWQELQEQLFVCDMVIFFWFQ
jgi:hypothetical protein